MQITPTSTSSVAKLRPNTQKVYNWLVSLSNQKQITPPKPVVSSATINPIWYVASGVAWLGLATGIMMLGGK